MPAPIETQLSYDGAPALLTRKYALGNSKDLAASGYNWSWWAEDIARNAVRQLEDIEAAMVDGRIAVDDLQFLIGRKGDVVIADPMGIHRGAAYGDALEAPDEVIADVIRRIADKFPSKIRR